MLYRGTHGMVMLISIWASCRWQGGFGCEALARYIIMLGILGLGGGGS